LKLNKKINDNKGLKYIFKKKSNVKNALKKALHIASQPVKLEIYAKG